MSKPKLNVVSRHRRWLFAGIVIAGGLAFVPRLAAHADPAVPAAAYDPADAATSETALLSGGCFWAMQGVFEHVKGVTKVYAGYAGGASATAQYEIVSTGETGHAETVQIQFDPRVISYAKILQIYVSVAADPTQLNYQGPDSGTQYRSEIWYESPAQQKIATAYMAQLGKANVFGAPIVVRIDPAVPFYKAENYHQDFLVLHPDYPYIVINDLPKVQNLKTTFPQFYSATPITVNPVG
jgi:peptide-methionine (S)-S-oxide reductase